MTTKIRSTILVLGCVGALAGSVPAIAADCDEDGIANAADTSDDACPKGGGRPHGRPSEDEATEEETAEV